MNKKYEISMEIEGKYGMFKRPDTGSEGVSYPCPTFSAAKGIFESVFFLKTATVIPYKTEICLPIQYITYNFNYKGLLKKKDLEKEDKTQQIRNTILYNCCYKLYAYVINDEKYKINNAHSYQEQFFRRLKKGQCNKIPVLGWSEFLPSYFGILREETKPVKHNEIIISFLKSPFDKLQNGNSDSIYYKNTKIENGVVEYD